MRAVANRAGLALTIAAVVGTAALVGPQALAGQAGTTTAAQVAVTTAKGPDPSEESVRARTGPFAVAKEVIGAQSGRGFNRGTVHYPTDTSQGRFGAIAVIPGFLENQGAVAWYGSTMASHGFVVFTVQPFAVTDFPDPRSDQLLAAVRWLATGSPVADRVDPTRLAVMGHSMGGGGALIAASKDPALKAAVPLAPWSLYSDFSGVSVPTMIVGADRDGIAPTARHADPMYASLRDRADQGYLKLRGADHFTTNAYSPTVTRFVVSWLKRHVDGDRRYDRFLCPAPQPDATFVSFRLTCSP